MVMHLYSAFPMWIYYRNHWTVSTLKKTIDCIWILGVLTWPFGAARLVTWHYVLFGGRRTLLQNQRFRKNLPPWEINWKGYYRNHSTVTILSNWFPTVESSSLSIYFEAKFFCRRKEHYVTWLIWPLQKVTWASPKFKWYRSFFPGANSSVISVVFKCAKQHFLGDVFQTALWRSSQSF